MTLEDLGYNHTLEKFRMEHDLMNFEVGRIVLEHRERYIIKTIHGEFEGEITGNMRFAAKSREDFPAVGDWVAMVTYATDFAIIHAILPRSSVIKRKAVGQFGEIQIIATNIDCAFLVQAVDRDFNINRLERYLTICHSSKVSPAIVLTKTDLIDEIRLNEIQAELHARVKEIPVFPISNANQQGMEALQAFIEKGETYCLLGSSGVGKSSLLNNLSGAQHMKTANISQSTSKGKHITSHRELVILDNGGILIDNPGMREVGIADTSSGLETTFDIILTLSKDCKFKDCTHTKEIGCRVLDAVEKGEIDTASYENFLKMEKEKAYFESNLADRKRREKEFGRLMKRYKKDINTKK